MAWLAKMPAPAPRRVFVNHGEPQAVDALRVKIQDALGWTGEPAVPEQDYVLE
ncbi:MAG: MBL fold metallo-hydrolase RNA specificity domain-containing protein [Bacteroidota bacterium]